MIGDRGANGLVSREVHLVARPNGTPSLDHFSLASSNVTAPGPGELLVRNLWLSVDPYMRNRMDAAAGYQPPNPLPGLAGFYVGAFELNQPMLGGAIGQVVQSASPDFAEGDYVESMLGWREYAAASDTAFRKLNPNPDIPLSAYLGALGMTGLTAYAGLFAVGQLAPGETLFVSAAAGSVGTVACQLAKARDCRVVGTAGSRTKVNWLTEVAGIDRAIDYKSCGDLSTALADACPNGIDLHLANVGGEHLDAALANMSNFGRIAISGMVDSYNRGTITPLSNLFMAVRRSLRIEGYTQLSYQHLLPRLREEAGTLIQRQKLFFPETIVEGLESAPQAFLDLFEGKNVGKMVVRVSP
jgi:NADPH-dependent curcumin reductase CurA